MITIATTGLEDYLEGGKGKIKLLVAGMPGAGKTRMSSFSPRPIYIAAEEGLMSVADRNVPYGHVKSEEDMNDFISLLKGECRKPEPQRRWETVVLDTIDAYQRTITQQYLKRKKKTEMQGFEDWGWLDSRMTSLVADLMELPMNVIVLAHLKEKKANKKDADIDRFVLKLQGDIREQLPADFDFVGMFDNDFDLVDGKRGRVRSILWESQPNAEWLKARGGALTRTPVNFEEADFNVIRDAIRAQLEGLKASEVIEQVSSQPAQQQPMPNVPGGPVSTGTKPVTGPAAPPPVAKPATPAAPPAAAPPVAAPPPAARRPVPPPPPSQQVNAETAIENVETVLGGKVLEDSANPAPAEAPADLPAEEGATTPVVEAPVADQEPAPAEAEAPAEAAELGSALVAAPGPEFAGEFTTTCGSPRYPDSDPHDGVGCGQPMTVTLTDGKVTAAEEGQMPGLMDIGGIKFRAFLHNACFQAARNK